MVGTGPVLIFVEDVKVVTLEFNPATLFQALFLQSGSRRFSW